MEVDRISILQLHSRYEVSKSTFYKRIKSLQIIVEREKGKNYVSLIQLQLLDALHQHIEQGGTTKRFINSNPLIKSSSSFLQIPDSSGEVLSFQSKEIVVMV